MSRARSLLSRRRLLAGAGAAALFEVGCSKTKRAAPVAANADPIAGLVAAAAATVAVAIEPDHYARYFAWRTTHLPDAASLYRSVVELLDRTAAAEKSGRFVEASEEVRRRLLATAAKGEEGRALRERFVPEVLKHFARTDVWIAIGYPSWPGRPRGFGAIRGPGQE